MNKKQNINNISVNKLRFKNSKDNIIDHLRKSTEKYLKNKNQLNIYTERINYSQNRNKKPDLTQNQNKNHTQPNETTPSEKEEKSKSNSKPKEKEDSKKSEKSESPLKNNSNLNNSNSNKEETQTEQNDLLIDLQKELFEKTKEMRNYIIINNKQRTQLQNLSKEIDGRINNYNLNSIAKIIKRKQKENIDKNLINFCPNKIKRDEDEVQLKISSKERQLQNILRMIEILEKDNEKMKEKIKCAKNTEGNLKLIENQKEQLKEINNLTNEIKNKKNKLIEHKKCYQIKEDLLKKVELIKDEIKQKHDQYLSIKKHLETFLENKKKIKEKETKEQNKETNTDNKEPNIQENIKNLNNKEITNSNKNQKPNNTVLLGSRKKAQNYEVPKQKPAKKVVEENSIVISPQVAEIFNEKELKAIYYGLNKNKTKYENVLKKFGIQNSYLDTLEIKHKLNVKKKLNLINDLDEQIEFLFLKKDEYNANIKIIQKDIDKVKEEKKIYDMKLAKILGEAEDKKKSLSKKNEEIHILGEHLIKMKKIMRTGDICSLADEPDIVIKNESEENSNQDQEQDQDYQEEQEENYENTPNKDDRNKKRNSKGGYYKNNKKNHLINSFNPISSNQERGEESGNKEGGDSDDENEEGNGTARTEFYDNDVNNMNDIAPSKIGSIDNYKKKGKENFDKMEINSDDNKWSEIENSKSKNSSSVL